MPTDDLEQVRQQVTEALDAVDRLLGVKPRPRLRLVRGSVSAPSAVTGRAARGPR